MDLQKKFKLSSKQLSLFMTIFLLFQIVMIVIINLTLSKENIDCDSAKLFVHAIEMWKNKTFIIPDWVYITTLELDCSLFLAVPLFGLIGDIYLAFSLSNIIFLFLLLATIFYLFKQKSSLYPLFICILICIPYRIGQLDYMNMLYFNGSQYIIKCTLPLMLLALLTDTYSFKSNKKSEQITKLLFSIVFCSLAFITALSSGVYVVFCGFIPVIAGYFLFTLINKQRLPLSFWAYSIITLFTSLIGIISNSLLNISAKGNSMTLCNIYGELQSNIISCFWGIFEVFGGVAYSNVEVMSYGGINIILRMFFVFILLSCAAITFKRVLKQKSNVTLSTLLLLLLWNIFILCITKTQYGAPTFEYRYHLIGIIPLLCIAAVTLIDCISKWEFLLKTLGVTCISVLILTLSFTSYKDVFNTKIDNSSLQEICDYAYEVGVDYVYFLYESEAPEICRLLDYENVIYLQAMGDERSHLIDYYEVYNELPLFFDNSLIILDQKIYDYGETMELYGRVFERCNIIGTKNIYR